MQGFEIKNETDIADYRATKMRGPITVKSDNWKNTASEYLISVYFKNPKSKPYFGPYYMGSAHASGPKLADWLASIRTDFYAGMLSFNDFCSEFGYDSDSINDFNTYQACMENVDLWHRIKATKKLDEYLAQY